MESSKNQAGKYAAKLGMDSVTIALLTPVEDENILKRLSGQRVIDSVNVTVYAIGWAQDVL